MQWDKPSVTKNKLTEGRNHEREKYSQIVHFIMVLVATFQESVENTHVSVLVN